MILYSFYVQTDSLLQFDWGPKAYRTFLNRHMERKYETSIWRETSRRKADQRQESMQDLTDEILSSVTERTAFLLSKSSSAEIVSTSYTDFLHTESELFSEESQPVRFWTGSERDGSVVCSGSQQDVWLMQAIIWGRKCRFLRVFPWDRFSPSKREQILACVYFGTLESKSRQSHTI